MEVGTNDVTLMSNPHAVALLVTPCATPGSHKSADVKGAVMNGWELIQRALCSCGIGPSHLAKRDGLNVLTWVPSMDAR